MDIVRISDPETLAALRLAFLDEGGAVAKREALAAALREYFAASIGTGLHAFGAVEGGQVVSCAFLVIRRVPPAPAFPDGVTGTVMNVFTLPGYRRRGYARAVMESLVAAARELGANRLDLSATRAAGEMYARSGFLLSPYCHMRLDMGRSE
ncbi:MAG: GNAT family N-acetyltransferase [Rikenellaceae bacterium]|nr:GNAT family N-acetyltransferase [Rikenellaceae bacterium]